MDESAYPAAGQFRAIPVWNYVQVMRSSVNREELGDQRNAGRYETSDQPEGSGSIRHLLRDPVPVEEWPHFENPEYLKCQPARRS
jgi:hypothetical protein